MVKIVERELEDFFYTKKEDGRTVFPPTDEEYDYVYRQFHLKPYGIIDLLYIDCNYHDDVRIHIVELKKDRLDSSALIQIAKYKQGIKHHINLLFPNTERQPNIEITGSLVGTEQSGEDMCFLMDSIPWLTCYLYKISLEKGIEFKAVAKPGDGLNWYMPGESIKPLTKLKNRLVKDYARSRHEFREWQKNYDSNKSNVVDFKK